jgi:hypothetical protein
MKWRFTGLALLAALLTGCGRNGTAEVPKNPVPLEKPGVAANLEGGKAGAGSKPQAGPAEKVKNLP